MSGDLRFDPDDVYEAGDRLMQVGIRVRNLVERQVANHPVPDLPPSLTTLRADLTAAVARMRPDISEIILVGQQMKDDARSVGEVDVYYDMPWSQKAALALDANPGIVGDKISDKLKSDAEWWRQQGVWPAAALLDGTRDLGAGLEGLGVIAGEVAAGNFEKPRNLVDQVRHHPGDTFRDAINWELLKTKPHEWVVRSLPSVAFALISGGSSSTTRVPKPHLPEVPARMRIPEVKPTHVVPQRRPLVTGVADGAAKLGMELIDAATASARKIVYPAVDAIRVAIAAPRALAQATEALKDLVRQRDAAAAHVKEIEAKIAALKEQHRTPDADGLDLADLESQLGRAKASESGFEIIVSAESHVRFDLPVAHEAVIASLSRSLPPTLRLILLKALEQGGTTSEERRSIVEEFFRDVLTAVESRSAESRDA